ncbi:MAG: hypothetical protein ACJ72T_01505 [Nitrososphaeraceae archaeon]
MKWNWRYHMTVIPVSFNVGHKEMLGHAKMIMVKGQVAINPFYQIYGDTPKNYDQ